MAVEFKREILYFRFLDPAKNFAEDLRPFELRSDPLTHHTSVIYTFRYRVPDKPELSLLVEKSLASGCPFCPQAINNTMKFPPDLVPEGRIQVGEACVFPSITPYAPYSTVTVLSHQHFIPLSGFSPELLINGFSACQVYLKRVSDSDPSAKYCSIIWNYMPPSGGTMLHPHLQAIAEYTPSRYTRELLRASQRYYKSNVTNFWSDLVAKETELGERYIATIGNISWLFTFAPKTWLGDVLAIFRGRNSFLDLPWQDLEHFSQGLIKLFCYMSEQNIYSFNLSIYSGVGGKDYFWTHARIVPRFTMLPLGNSDISSVQLLLDKYCCFIMPEEACRELKEYF